MIGQSRFQFAFRAGLIHLLVSVLVTLLVAGVVFTLWYPYPYRELSGGRDLFFLIISVDVVCGPLLTLILASPIKAKRELALDFGLVGLIQVTALVYGLFSLSLARPVALVFEVDRFRSVTAADISAPDLTFPTSQLIKLSLTGPRLLSIRDPKSSDEKLKSIELSFQGIEPSMRPQWWVPYEGAISKVLLKAKPIQALRQKHPKHVAEINKALQDAGLQEDNSVWLPLVSRISNEWVIVLDAKTAQPKAYLPLDGF